jgi:hypothetical protein
MGYSKYCHEKIQQKSKTPCQEIKKKMSKEQVNATSPQSHFRPPPRGGALLD